jgi:hypothetical protein
MWISVRLCGWYTVVELCGMREWCGGRGLQESTSESLEWNPISVGVLRCLNLLRHRTAVRFIFEGFTVLGRYAVFGLTYFGTPYVAPSRVNQSESLADGRNYELETALATLNPSRSELNPSA